jgi:GTP-binding protein
MTTDTDAKLVEQGRKLFAGDWQFFWASPSIETLPPMAGMEVAFAGRSNVGKSSLINALTGRNALASGWSTCPVTATPPRRRPRWRPGPS